ncbi:unnamed protein product [Absidia cylindrospora]
MLRFILVQNCQGKTRLAKWYVPYEDDEKSKLKGEVHRLIAPEIKDIKATLLSSGTTRWSIADMLDYSFVCVWMLMIMNCHTWRLFTFLWRYWMLSLVMCANWIWSSTSTRFMQS